MLTQAVTTRLDGPNAPPTLLSASQRLRDHDQASVRAAPIVPDQGTRGGSGATEARRHHRNHLVRSPPLYPHPRPPPHYPHRQ